MLSADLTGKTAFVTGASSGLGQHFAGVLARAGARVVLATRRLEALREVAEEIASKGGKALAAALDVRDSRSVEEAIGHRPASGRPDLPYLHVVATIGCVRLG